ncbi:mechanosensitive ion channel family protein [Ornithinimicrobium cerasi]|uniref:mechanosensitive ion channel family protein n=1 Tax=Ornithinimicrobium cerasi TaxID=2248773 RepID=UPI000F00067F|nr:hypothetical protein [Ornithinimicrobium cerasi]
MTEPLEQLWAASLLYVPKIVSFLLILIIGWIIAKALGSAVDKILERVGFDRAVERGGIRKALASSRYDASAIVGKVVYYALLLFVLQMAFGVFGPNPVSALLTSVIAFLPRIAVAIVIVVIAAAVAAAVKDIIANTLSGLSYGRALGTTASVLILGLGLIAALDQVGIATTVTTPVLIAVLATIAGILVVGVGGGLIKPMQARWETYLDTLAQESQNIRAEAANGPSLTEQAKATAAKARTQPAPRSGTGATAADDVPFDVSRD